MRGRRGDQSKSSRFGRHRTNGKTALSLHPPFFLAFPFRWICAAIHPRPLITSDVGLSYRLILWTTSTWTALRAQDYEMHRGPSQDHRWWAHERSIGVKVHPMARIARSNHVFKSMVLILLFLFFSPYPLGLRLYHIFYNHEKVGLDAL